MLNIYLANVRFIEHSPINFISHSWTQNILQLPGKQKLNKCIFQAGELREDERLLMWDMEKGAGLPACQL